MPHLPRAAAIPLPHSEPKAAVHDAHHRLETASGAEEVNRPAWTITEAVERTDASRSTIRRYRDSGKFPHAYKDSGGVWRFPLEDLLAAGLRLIDPAHAEHVTTASEQGQPAPEHPSEELLSKVTELERELAVEKARNEGLERLAQAAQENVIDLRRALRMLEVGKPEQVSAEPVNKVSEQAVSTPDEQLNQVSEQVAEPPVRSRWKLFSGLLGKG
jgi:DNA-binding transcriptional MerR regulator